MGYATVSEDTTKPVLDEETLDKLFEAAFVLQEHNRERRELELRIEAKRNQLEDNERAAVAEKQASSVAAPQPATPADYSMTLGKILETQRQIQVRHLGLDQATELVAERVIEISGASGAAIAIVDGMTVRYQASCGRTRFADGTTIAREKALGFLCIETGQVLRCSDAKLESALAEECSRREIRSLIAAPIFRDGNVAGTLELHYSKPNGFTDQDVHTCQLMAGLITEALVRDEEQTWRKSLESERAAMMGALEKLQPNLAALAETSGGKNGTPLAPLAAAASLAICRKCGHQFLAEEQFCGECGSPRSGAYSEDPSKQSKVASLDPMRETEQKERLAVAEKYVSTQDPESPHREAESASAHAIEKYSGLVNSPTASPAATTGEAGTELLLGVESGEESDADDGLASEDPAQAAGDHVSAGRALQKLDRAGDWSSAASAREFLEQLAGGKRTGSLARFWSARRGDIYLTISIILVAWVILWGVFSNHAATVTGAATATSAASAQRKAPDAELSFLDRMLISLGLAEAPETSADQGNPATQVWIDQRTALYYCPGADLYGRTPKGRFSSQRDAQLDQFEPAYRKVCN